MGGHRVDDNREVAAYVYGTVPRCMPQTSQSSEYMAAEEAVEHLVTDSVLTGDCSNVVRDLSLEQQSWPHMSTAYAATMRRMSTYEGAIHLEKVEKVKSHLTENSTNSNLLNRQICGNNKVDEYALKAEGLHPLPELDVQKRISLEISDAKNVVKVIGHLLPLWPWSNVKHKRTKTTKDSTAGNPS